MPYKPDQTSFMEDDKNRWKKTLLRKDLSTLMKNATEKKFPKNSKAELKAHARTDIVPGHEEQHAMKSAWRISKQEAGEENMVDYSKYKASPVGEKSKTKITETNEGVQSDFRTENYWAATNLTRQQISDAKEQKAIEVKTENNASMVINLPQGEFVHPKSTLAKFQRTYGKYPEIGMEVDTKLDENGFNRIVIEA